MIVEINEIFIAKTPHKSPLEIILPGPEKIKDLMDRLGVKNIGYAIYFVNDVVVDDEFILQNEDKLVLLPIFGGG